MKIEDLREFFTDFHFVCRKSHVPLETLDIRWCLDIYFGYYKHLAQFMEPLKEMNIGGKSKSFKPPAGIPPHLRKGYKK